MELIEFNGVSKVYAEGDTFVQALDSASFKISEGEFISIMGPSGSGKSTLLSILGVLNTPTHGDVFIDDLAVYDLSSEKQADFRYEYLGFVFQSYQLVPYLTVIENIMIPLSITPISKREQEEMAREVMEQFGLSDKENRLPNQLSGGEGQRVAIARALVNKPPILLADEPTGNLDSKKGMEILDLLKTLNKDGQTIIMVTHDENLAHYADRFLHIMDGRVVK
ncbi:MAG: ABC transporter ATP-binding protein [Methanobacteriota archaeon]